MIDLTPYEEHAQFIYIGLLQHSRIFAHINVFILQEAFLCDASLSYI
jgi:hypothetical protein